MCSVADTFRTIPVKIDTSVAEVVVRALDQFGLDTDNLNRYRLVEVSLEKGCKSDLFCNRIAKSSQF